ncbi:MAG: hypothetical protein MZV63_23045 [Marinilabiliales bacterium]|nr:hypothetical protein [Marinilabiliales bacterium]
MHTMPCCSLYPRLPRFRSTGSITIEYFRLVKEHLSPDGTLSMHPDALLQLFARRATVSGFSPVYNALERGLLVMRFNEYPAPRFTSWHPTVLSQIQYP